MCRHVEVFVEVVTADAIKCSKTTTVKAITDFKDIISKQRETSSVLDSSSR